MKKLMEGNMINPQDLNPLRSYFPRPIEDGISTPNLKGDQFSYLIMEYIDESLIKYIRNNQTPMNFDQIFIDVCVKMLNCLHSLHNKYYIHRDVKPENFRVKDNQVYIIDFATANKFIDYH